MLKASVKAAVSALCIGLFTCLGFVSEADAAAKCIKGDRKAPFTLGWANIYSVPTWMKQTEGTIAAEGVAKHVRELSFTRPGSVDASGSPRVRRTLPCPARTR